MQDHIPDALIAAFERQYDASWNDPQLRNERLAMRYGWAAAVEAKQCLHQIQEPAPATAMDALREAEAALEVAMARILKANPGHSISVTSEAKALVIVRAALAATPASGTAAPVVLPAGWVAIPLEPTESQWLDAQGTFLDMNWDAVTCLAARIQALIASTRKQWASACAAHQGQADARDLLIESAVMAERERICAAIKAEDDHCVTEGDYMLDSDDCIKVARGEWVRPVYDAAIAAAKPHEEPAA